MYYTDDNTWARKRIYYIYTLGRMTDVVNKYSNGTAFSSFTYTLDDLGRRIKKTYNVGGDYVDYAYDAVSQLLNENRYNSGDTLQYALGWTYDNSGNRLVQDDSVNGQTTYNYSNYLLLDNAVGPVNTRTSPGNSAGSARSRRGSYARSDDEGVSEAYVEEERRCIRSRRPEPEGARSFRSHLCRSSSMYAIIQLPPRFSTRTKFLAPEPRDIFGTGSYSFTYNAAGDTIQEMINSGVIVKTFAYDEMGRMNSFGDNSNNATYANCPACSAVNQRVSTNANNVYTRYFFDGNDVVADYASDATLQRRYLHLGMDETAYMEIESGDNQGTYYFFHDGLGSVTDILDSSGNRVNAYDYYAYGEDYGTPTEGIQNRYKFANREHDTWSGNYYNRNRYYNSSNGRFGQRDSMGMGWYYYPTPTLATDPTGRQAEYTYEIGDECLECEKKCIESLMEDVFQGFKNAKNYIDSIKESTDSNGVIPESASLLFSIFALNKNDTDLLDEMYEIMVEMEDDYLLENDLVFECEEECDPVNIMSYVNDPPFFGICDTIHICPAFFCIAVGRTAPGYNKLPHESLGQFLVDTILHEISHAGGWTGDEAFIGTAAYNNLSKSDRVNNADNWTEFFSHFSSGDHIACKNALKERYGDCTGNKRPLETIIIDDTINLDALVLPDEYEIIGLATEAELPFALLVTLTPSYQIALPSITVNNNLPILNACNSQNISLGCNACLPQANSAFMIERD